MAQKRTKISSINITYKKIVLIFIIAVVLLVSIILYFSLAKAKIYLKIKSQPAKISFTTQVKEDVEADNNYLETNILKGRILELVMEKTKEFTIKGQEQASEKYGGIMTIVNDKSEDQLLVSRTRFESTNGKIFRIHERIIVPAKGSIDAYVISDEVGEGYKELPGKFILPGFKNEYSRTKVYGQTTETMVKKSITSYIIAQEDIDNVKDDVISELEKDALNKLRELLIRGEQLSESDITTEIISSESTKEIGEESKDFEYTIKLKVIGVVFKQDELLTLAQSFLNNQLTETQQLVNYNNDSFEYDITNYAADEKSITLEVELSAEVMQNTRSESLDKGKFKGLTQREIIDYLDTLPAMDSVEVIFSPFWVKQAPRFSDHIEIIINSE